jgi:hypothetical protein
MAKKVMKKYQAGGGTTQPAVRPGNTVKPPRSIRGPKQSPSDMRQPFGPSQKPVGPGNTAKPPKSVRKAKPTMQPSMRKGGSMRGKSC